MNPQQPQESPDPQVAPPEHTAPEPEHAQGPAEPQSDQHPKRSKTLAIIMVVVAILLLVSIGVALWVSLSTPTNNNADVTLPEDTASVTRVDFVAPGNMPQKYKKTEREAPYTRETIYFDAKSVCGITASVISLGDATGKTPRDVIDNTIKSSRLLGVDTTAKTPGSAVTLKDAGEDRSYDFETLALEQTLDLKGSNVNKQTNVIVYKQFGYYTAALAYSCKQDSWAKTKTELENLVSNFTIKTERQGG